MREIDPAGGLGLAKKLAGVFLETSVDLLQHAAQALLDGDAEALRCAGHTLKSTAANIGASALSDLCRELETCGRENRLADAPPLMEATRQTHAQTAGALRDWLRKS